MSRPLLYLPAVARDYADAFNYYEALSASAALSFDRVFSQAGAGIESGLVTHQRVFDDYHRVHIGQFPYTLYYRITDRHTVIVAVLYSRFSPQRIEQTLRARS